MGHVGNPGRDLPCVRDDRRRRASAGLGLRRRGGRRSFGRGRSQAAGRRRRTKRPFRQRGFHRRRLRRRGRAGYRRRRHSICLPPPRGLLGRAGENFPRRRLPGGANSANACPSAETRWPQEIRTETNTKAPCTYLRGKVRHGPCRPAWSLRTARPGARSASACPSTATSWSRARPAHEQGAGAAYVFQRQGASWGDPAKLTGDEGAFGGNFGVSVSIDGDRLIAGSPYVSNATGAAFVFRLAESAWVREARLVPACSLEWGRFRLVRVHKRRLRGGRKQRRRGVRRRSRSLLFPL